MDAKNKRNFKKFKEWVDDTIFILKDEKELGLFVI